MRLSHLTLSHVHSECGSKNGSGRIPVRAEMRSAYRDNTRKVYLGYKGTRTRPYNGKAFFFEEL